MADWSQRIEGLARLLKPAAFERTSGMGHQEFAEDDREEREVARAIARETLDQARQEVLEEVREGLEKEVAASRQFVIYGVNVKQLQGRPLSEREITEGLIVINRGVVTRTLDRLATLDPSGEEKQVVEDRATVVLSLREANTAVIPLKAMVHTGKAVPGSPVAQVAEVLIQRIADAYVGKKPVPRPSGEQGEETQAVEKWERVAPADLQAGDLIRLDVFDGEFGWEKQRREVLSDDGRTFRMRGHWDGEDHEYDWVPAEDKHCNGQSPVQRVIERLTSATPATPATDTSKEEKR